MGKTSSAVHNRYTNKAYDRLAAFVPKGMRERFKEACARRGTSMNAVIRAAIEKFLAEEDGE